MDKEKILGFDVCITSQDNLIENIFKDYSNRLRNFIVNINPEIVTKNHKNSDLKNIFNLQRYQIADGIGIICASKLNKGNIKTRITGIDLMYAICKASINYNTSIFLYGSKEGIAERAKSELEKQYNGINIVGTSSGYVDETFVIEQINKSNATILFVGLGCPKQEEFIIRNMDKLKNIQIFMPVGGSFDVISGSLKRAPNWIIKMNLEWLYRLFQEPKRFFRQLNLIKFLFLNIFRRKIYD